MRPWANSLLFQDQRHLKPHIVLRSLAGSPRLANPKMSDVLWRGSTVTTKSLLWSPKSLEKQWETCWPAFCRSMAPRFQKHGETETYLTYHILFSMVIVSFLLSHPAKLWDLWWETRRYAETKGPEKHEVLMVIQWVFSHLKSPFRYITIQS